MSRAKKVAVLLPIVLAIALWFGPGLSSDARDPRGTGALDVLVHDARGRPRIDVEITVVPASTSAPRASRRTDASGRARFDALPAGSAEIELPGAPDKTSVDVRPGAIRHIELELDGKR